MMPHLPAATPMKTPRDVLEALVAAIPTAMVSLDEISEALGLPPLEAVVLVNRAEEQRVIDVWQAGRALYCCLSGPEARRRGLWLKAPGQTYRKRKNGTKVHFSFAEIAGQYRWTDALVPPGDSRDYQDAQGSRLPRRAKKRRTTRPLIVYERQADGTFAGIVVTEERPGDQEADTDSRVWSDAGDSWDAEANWLAEGRGRAARALYRHVVANDDPMDVEPTGSNAVADWRRRLPTLKWPTKGLCPWLERFSDWPKKKPWPEWLRRYMAAPWPPNSTAWEIHLYLLQFARRPSGPRPIQRHDPPPGILLGLARPNWTPDCEQGSPCPVCGDRPLSENEHCLGCGRISDLLLLTIGLARGTGSRPRSRREPAQGPG